MAILNRNIPYLFSVPGSRDIVLGLISSIMLLFFSIIWIMSSSSFERGSIYVFPVIAIFIHTYTVLKYTKNILYVLRYGLLVVIGVGASIAWSLSENVLIAPFGPQYQTHESTSALVGSVLLAASGSTIGWFLGFYKKKYNNLNQYAYPRNFWVLIKWISIIVIIFIVAIFVYRSGGIVSSQKAYAAGGNDTGIEFGAFNVILFFFSALFIFSSIVLRDLKLKIFIFIVFSFFTPVLTGSRADFLIQGSLLCFIIASMMTSNNVYDKNPPFLLIFFGVALLYFMSKFIGVWRGIGDVESAMQAVFGAFSFFSDRSSGVVLSLSTANQMAGTFYAVFAKTNILNGDFLLGQSYADFILRTPPGFLGLPRPQDLSWEMVVGNQRMAQGGIYEVAEAYWNFWYFGAFFIPLTISRFMSYLLYKSLVSVRYWILFGSWFVAFSLMAPRAVWYQTFAYWRVSTVVVVFFLIGVFLSYLMLKPYAASVNRAP